MVALCSLSSRLFQPPWSVEEPDPKLQQQCFIVRDATGKSLGYFYYDDGAVPPFGQQAAHQGRGAA